MKYTVFTVMTVLLLIATLCLPATAQTWQRINSHSPAVDDDEKENDGTAPISDIAFRDDDLVCFGKGAHIFSWNINTGSVWEVDHGSTTFLERNRVSKIAIPRRNGSVVIYGHGGLGRGRLEIRRTDNLSHIANTGAYDWLDDLSVDDLGDYVVGHTTGSLNTIFEPRYFTFDIWGHNGWQLERNDMHIRGTFASAILPVRKGGFPHRYFCFYSDPDAIREKAGKQPYWGDTYITGWGSNEAVDDIAVGVFQGYIRIAGLIRENDHIDVWNWSGERLFTFNRSRTHTNLHKNILEFTPNGELLATATRRKVIFWDMSTREEDPSSFTPDIPSSTRINALAISDSGRRIAVGSTAGRVYIYRWTGDTAPVAPAKETETQPTALLENYPNPFNPETWIPYQLSEAAEVTVTIHASDGKLVRTLELGQMPAGAYSDKDRAAYWDGQNEQGEPVASGVYFYTLTAGDFKATRKMVIRK